MTKRLLMRLFKIMGVVFLAAVGIVVVFLVWVGVRLAEHTREPVVRFYAGKSLKQKRPIVLVHGLNRTGRIWVVADDGHGNEISGAKSMVNVLRRNGYPNIYVNTFSDTRNTSLRENAVFLKKWILDAKRRFRADKVDIVAHSMGALIARAYIQEMDRIDGNVVEAVRYEDDVSRLIMIAAPHLGSPLADAFAGFLNLYVPKTLQSGGGPDLKYLNKRRLSCEVNYYSLILSAGKRSSRRRSIFWRFVRLLLTPSRLTDGDGTVGLASQNMGEALTSNNCPKLTHSAFQIRAEPGIRHRDAVHSPSVQRTVLKILSP